ncbi:MAG: PQQ-binding-like beta-propeller repeat protein [bacterium]
MRIFQKNIFGKQAKQTNDCGYIVAYDGKLTKLNELGETKWESEISLKQRKHSNLGKPSVIQTSDGGYLYSDNYGVAKVSSSGEIEWTNKQYGDFEDAIEHSNGYFYVVSDDLVAHKSLAKVYKFSSNGNKVWIKRFGGGCSWEKLRSILETSDGELIIVGGKSHGNNRFACTFEFYDDAWIIKVDADSGVKIWEKTYGGKNFERFEDIVKNPNGGYYAIGTACNKKNPPEAGDLCASNMSALWMKIDDSGNSLGKKHYTIGPNQTGFSITNTSSGGTAWVGLNKKKVGSTTLYQAVFAKLTGTPTVNYSKVVDLGSGNATSIELTKDGGFIIVAGKNVFKTDSDMKIPTLETNCNRSNKNHCP